MMRAKQTAIPRAYVVLLSVEIKVEKELFITCQIISQIPHYLGSDKEIGGKLVLKPFLYSLAKATVQPRVKAFLCSLPPSKRWEDCLWIAVALDCQADLL